MSSSTSPPRGIAARLRTESGSAVLLVVVTCFALLWANSPLSSSYFELWQQSVGIDVGPFGLHLDLHHWINDGLMVVFFFGTLSVFDREIDRWAIRASVDNLFNRSDDTFTFGNPFYASGDISTPQRPVTARLVLTARF